MTQEKNIIARNKELELTNEKLQRSEKILTKAYYDLKEREQDLELLNKKLEQKNEALTDALNQLKEAQSQLVQSEKMASLGTLTAGIAHEINNPLNYIMCGYSGLKEFFDETGYPDDEAVLLLINSIKTGIERTRDIVSGLNNFSRDNEDFTEECNIHEIIDNCLTILGNNLKFRILVKKHYCEERITVPGNVGKLHQVFINLITNAYQAIEKKGEITIRTAIQDNKCIIELEDNGSGIANEAIEKIIDPFFTTKAPGEGTGLGLSIAYSIIKQHKGEFKVRSVEKEGTTVTLIFPIK